MHILTYPFKPSFFSPSHPPSHHSSYPLVIGNPLITHLTPHPLSQQVAINHPVGPGTDLLFDGWSSMNLNSQNKEATKGVTSVPLSFLQQFFTDNPTSNNNNNNNSSSSNSNSKNESPVMVIDWLKVDVEGYEQEVLKTVPASMSISSLSIEASYCSSQTWIISY